MRSASSAHALRKLAACAASSELSHLGLWLLLRAVGNTHYVCRCGARAFAIAHNVCCPAHDCVVSMFPLFGWLRSSGLHAILYDFVWWTPARPK